ncbi:MAG: threonylcarbamoyl-AMP synthase [Bacteroidaceae bacterium]|nr:threonylcarbamoyl-AMP synthase [Bacteroidaceae bacterium]
MAKVKQKAAYEETAEKPKPKLPAAAREEIRRAVEVMERGGVILYPTDTVWGIGCDAANAEAVSRVYAIKQRSDAKALITLVDSEAKVQFYVRDVPPIAWDVMELSTKPTTIIFDGARNLAENLIAEDGSVGIRVTKESFSKELCFRMKRAIVSTSANVSGAPTPQNFAEISDEIRQAVDYVVDYRQKERTKATPSSIIKLGMGGEVKVIR